MCHVIAMNAVRTVAIQLEFSRIEALRASPHRWSFVDCFVARSPRSGPRADRGASLLAMTTRTRFSSGGHGRRPRLSSRGAEGDAAIQLEFSWIASTQGVSQ
jgi:hypothetical protein